MVDCIEKPCTQRKLFTKHTVDVSSTSRLIQVFTCFITTVPFQSADSFQFYGVLVGSYGVLVAEWLRRRTLGKKVVGSTPRVGHQGMQVGTACINPCLSPPRSVHVQLGTWYNNMHVTRRSVSANCKTIGSLPVKQVNTCMNDQG